MARNATAQGPSDRQTHALPTFANGLCPVLQGVLPSLGRLRMLAPVSFPVMTRRTQGAGDPLRSDGVDGTMPLVSAHDSTPEGRLEHWKGQST